MAEIYYYYYYYYYYNIYCSWVITRWQYTITHKQYIKQHKNI
jgi:hypothetical protein